MKLAKTCTFLTVAAAAAGLAPHAANAAPGQTAQLAGAAQATVVRAISIINLTDMRFGRFTQPTTSGTIVVSPSGTISTTGSMTTATAIAQVGLTRGAGLFLLAGDAQRAFSVSLPSSAQIASGTNQMTINNFSSNWVSGASNLGVIGLFLLNVGGTLNVAPNQAGGVYTGSYNVTVAYQ